MTERQNGHDHQVGQNNQTNPGNLETKKEKQVTPSSLSPECPSNIVAPNQQCYEPTKQENGREAQATSPATSIEHSNCTSNERQRLDASVIGQSVQNIRTTIRTELAVALDHVIADLRISKVEAVRDAIGLYLRYHGRGQGVPAPMPPVGRH